MASLAEPMICWRLYEPGSTKNPVGGFGSAENGGRWNSPGVRAVYCSATLSLAVLEVLVHWEDWSYLRETVYLAVEIDVPDRLVTISQELPADWNRIPSPRSTRQLGDQFLNRGSAIALRLPSAIVPSEANFMLNPLHPEFGRIACKKPMPFRFDERFGLK